MEQPGQAWRARIHAWLDEVFGMDLRGLAVYRVLLGLILLLDTADRLPDVAAHYTDAGALPRALVPGAEGRLSLHMLSGGPELQLALLALAAVAAVGVALGLGTRVSLLVSWVLNISIQTRNPLVLYGGDIVLREILFWSLFLPLGARWSLDARLGRGGGARALSMGTAAYLAQIALIYITTVMLKSGDDWRDGTAVWYALQIDHFTSPLGRELLAFPRLLALLTHAVFWFEAIGPWLLLVPRWWVRAPVVLGMIAMHLGFEMFMEIGLFPWISALSWIPLLPAAVWDRLRLPRLAGPTLGLGRPAQGLAALTLLYVCWWNLGSVYPKTLGVPGVWRAPARAVRLDQYWDMFAPEPLKDDGWFVAVGTRRDGVENDAIRGGPVSWAKPWDVANSYRNERWRKYMRNLWNRKYASLRDPYLGWICRTWNANAAKHAQLLEIELFYVLEQTPPPGQRARTERVPLRERSCEGGAPTPAPPAEGAPPSSTGAGAG